MHRTARVERTTKESSIVVELDLDGTGRTEVSTGVPFYDHMLTALGAHASFDLTVRSQGDIEIEAHHTVEDTAIVLGQALGQALGDKKGIRRFGDAFIPMDETLAHAVVDVSGRPYCVHTGEPDHLLHTIIPGSAASGSASSALGNGGASPPATPVRRHAALSLGCRSSLVPLPPDCLKGWPNSAVAIDRVGSILFVSQGFLVFLFVSLEAITCVC